MTKSVISFICFLFLSIDMCGVGMSLRLFSPALAEAVTRPAITELTLSNGMKVWLMPTDFETDEILIKMAAFGGYASLPASERFSGEMAAMIAWESGLDGMSSDQLSVYLYEHSLDLFPKIQPFCRIIEGNAANGELANLLKCISLLFRQQNFTLEGWRRAETEAENSLNKVKNDNDYLYETKFLQFNTQGVEFLKAMKPTDLAAVNFFAAKDIFQHSFSNADEFVCVIVGSFALDETQKEVQEFLGKIPKSALRFDYARTVSAPFPSGISEKQVHLKGRLDSLTRLTFPLKMAIDKSNLNTLAFTSQIIEGRLRKVLNEKMKQSHGIDVSYEFPLYPRLDNCWISIRFRSEVKEQTDLKQLILAQLNQLIEQGPSEAEMELIRKLELGNNEFWMKDNSYWVDTLTNYYLWGWPPSEIYSDLAKEQGITVKQVHQFLRQAISLQNYSIVIGLP
jgi:zinc protease